MCDEGHCVYVGSVSFLHDSPACRVTVCDCPARFVYATTNPPTPPPHPLHLLNPPPPSSSTVSDHHPPPLHLPTGNPIEKVYCNWEKKFAFIEFRSVEETSNSLALDGIMYDGVNIRIRRPSDYNPTAAIGQGPTHPNPNLNLAAIGMHTGVCLCVCVCVC